MKAVLAVLVLVAALVSANQFEEFKRMYDKKYHSAQEEAFRRVVFEKNMVTAAKLQAKNPHAKFGLSPFADRTEAEFKSYHRLDFTSMLKNRKTTPVDPALKAGNFIDWRQHGAVTEVKNQGQCGSCWAFSTTGNIEGQWFLAGNSLVSLSEQELVSCDTIDEGCQGGLPSDAYKWLLETTNGSIVTEASYPYVSGGGNVPSCQSPPGKFGARIEGSTGIPANESDMAAYCFANGPVSIGVDASSFQTYFGGILTNCESGQLDHAVLIVGYDLNNSPPYWIIKNSWGASWGESGYIRVEYGTNQCGLNQAATSALVKRVGPVPPSPPIPPTPPPTPSTTYQVSVCATGLCLFCQTSTQQDGACVAATIGSSNSFKASCTDSGTKVKMTSYTSADCSGTSTSTTYDANTCAADGSDYVKFQCY